jgi:6-phosphogluconolactonase (cycloisomerase 2 family)
MYVYKLDPETAQLTLLTIHGDVLNPAFMRYHPEKNVLYTCTESIHENGEVVCYSVSPTTGQLRELSRQNAGGTSTCYLTIDKEKENMLLVNYWDSSLGVLPLTPAGTMGPMKNKYVPPQKVVANHRDDHLKNRQSEPHAHAIVLDPVHGKIAYVPDLGLDKVKQYVFDSNTGKLTPVGMVHCGEETKAHLGPRYIEFHPSLNVAYVVNELESNIAVFEFDESAADTLINNPESEVPTLNLVQQISTIPTAFPKKMNTCGRITVSPCGGYVLVSNRGHNSITIFRVNQKNGGLLSLVGHFHTRGATPRHFQFDPSGKFVIVANQDSDNIAVFHFDQEKGTMQFSGNAYDVPSPNFVCVRNPYVYLKAPVVSK